MSESQSIYVSKEDCDLLNIKIGKSSGYARTTKRPQAYIHYIIAMRCGLSWNPKTEVIDHINRNKLDNRRKNLRIISRSKNATNSNRSDNAKGCYWSGTSWVAKLVIDGITYKRCFKNQSDAENYIKTLKKQKK